jgi:hypothetical protein
MSIAIAILIRYAEMGRLRRWMSIRSSNYIFDQFVDWGRGDFEVRHTVDGVDVLRKRNNKRLEVFGKFFRVFRKFGSLLLTRSR